MRRTSRASHTVLILILFSAAVWSQQPNAARQAPAQSAPDPLQGRWAGIVRSPQGGQMPAIVAFKKGPDGYSGAISDLQPNRPMIPFETVNYDEKEKKVVATFSFRPGNNQPTMVNISFALAGDALRGNTTIKLGSTAPVHLLYELKKTSDVVDSGLAANRQELEEYNQIRAEQDATAKKKLIDEFLQKHPKSSVTAYVLQEGALMGRQLNDLEMLSDYGERSIAIWPDNFVLLTELGNAYVRRRLLDRAEETATKAIAMAEKADRPAQVTETQWANGKKEVLIANYSTLGFVHVYRAQASKDAAAKKAEAKKAIDPFNRALEYAVSDDLSLYGLGVVYGILEDYPNAVSNLAKSVVLNGSVSSLAKPLLEEFYKSEHGGKLDGLDQVLAKAKSELGISR